MQRNSYVTGRMLVSFILASIMSSIILQINEMVDGIIVGNMISSDAISAIGLAQPLTRAVLFLPAVIYHGTTYVAAKYIGAQNYNRAGQLFTLCMILSPLVALIAVAPLLLYTERVIGFFTSDTRMISLLCEYLPWIMWSTVMYAFQTSITEFMKVVGRPKITFAIFAIQTFLNILLDLLLVRPFGISGAGMATLLSILLSGCVVLPFARNNKVISLESVNRQVCVEELPKSIKLGATASMLLLLFSFQNIALNYIFLHTLGTNAMFVISIYNQIMMVAYIVIVGAVDSVYQIGGTMYGEDDITGYRILYRIMLRLVAGGMAAITLGSVCFPTQIAAMFGADTQLAEWSRVPIILMAMQLIPFALVYLLTVNYNVVNFKKITVTVISIMPVLILTSVYLSSRFMPDAIWFFYTLSQWLLLGVALCASSLASTRSKEEITRFTLMPRKDPIPAWSVSFRCSEKNIREATGEVESFLSKNNFPESHSFSLFAADVVRAIASDTSHRIDFRVALYPSRLSLSIKFRRKQEVVLPAMPPAVTCDIKTMNEISQIHLSYAFTKK